MCASVGTRQTAACGNRSLHPCLLDSSFPSLLGAVASHSSALSPWSTSEHRGAGKGQGRASNHSSCSAGRSDPHCWVRRRSLRTCLGWDPRWTASLGSRSWRDHLWACGLSLEVELWFKADPVSGPELRWGPHCRMWIAGEAEWGALAGAPRQDSLEAGVWPVSLTFLESALLTMLASPSGAHPELCLGKEQQERSLRIAQGC